MQTKTRHRRRLLGIPLAIAALLACVAVSSSAATAAETKSNFRMKVHVIGGGASVMHSNCYRLLGTSGQTAPGYSSSAKFSVLSGFWACANALASNPPSTIENAMGCKS